MRAELLEEPELQFADGRHADPRFGLLELGPADRDAPGAPRTISVGVVGTRVSTPRVSPPFRGTHIAIDERCHLLYTTGSVPFYETYPGPYVPPPLSLTLEAGEGGRRHAIELLALTKLNWNHSRLDGHDPITTLAAKGIGRILRHVDAGRAVGNRYAYYI